MSRGVGVSVSGLALLLVTIASAGARAQSAQISLAQMQHRTWGERDGLPNDPLYSPRRSPDGYLWIGTNNALLRFDGMRFVRLDSTNTPALRTKSYSFIHPVLVDRSGCLWIARTDGVLVQYANGTFREFGPVDKDSSSVSLLIQDGSGLFWGIADGLFVIRGAQVVAPSLPTGVRAADVVAVVPDTGNGVWLGMRDGAVWNLTPSGAHRIETPPSGDGVTGRPVRRGAKVLIQTHDGRLWASTDVVHSFANGRWSTPMIGTPAHGFTPLRAIESKGDVFFATRGDGLIRWSAGVAEQYAAVDGLSGQSVDDFVADDESLWITTDAGLDQIRRAPFATLGKHDGLPFAAPRTLLVDDDGALWIVRGGTLDVFRVTGGMVTTPTTPLAVREVKLSDHSFDLITPALGGGVWYDRRDGHVARYHNGIETRLTAAGMPTSRVMAGYEDSLGGLWLSFVTHEFGVVRNGRYSPIALPGTKGRVGNIAPAGRDAVWVTLEDPKVDMIVKLARDSVVTWVESPGPTQTFFGDLLVEGTDTVWAIAGGVFVRVANNHASAVRVPEVARVAVGYAIALKSSGGYLWFAGESGLGRIRLNDLHRAADGVAPPPNAQIFGAKDGVAVPKLAPMNQRPAFRGTDGRIWFATPSGVAMMDPSQFHMDTTPPLVHIEETVAFGRTFAQASLITLAPNPERVEIHFTATELSVPERARIEYRLDGVNAAWVGATPERVATYTQLRPGTYRFHVRAGLEGGSFGRETSTTLRVRAAWYQMLWFKLFLAAAVLALIALLIYVTLRARARAHTERMRERFEAEINERTRLARELHDTLLQGFQGITLELQAVRRTLIGSPHDAESALSRVLEQADMSLRDARAMVWDMRAPELDVLNLHSALEAAARAVVASGIVVEWHVEGRASQLLPAVEMAVLRIGKEAIANAATHAGASTINVMLRYEARTLQLTVRDDGKGIDPDAVERANESGHWGLRGMQERADQIGAKLEITSINGRGSSVVLIVPTDVRVLPGSREPSSSLKR